MRLTKTFWFATCWILVAIVGTSFLYRASAPFRPPDPGPPFDLQRFGTIDIDESQNAFAEYEVAPLTRDPGGVDDAIRAGWSVAPANVVAWLETNRQSLELFRKGTARAGGLYGQPQDQSYKTMISVTRHQALSRLARLEAARLIADGDLGTAWDWYKATLRHSRHVGMYGTARARLVGTAFHAKAVEDITRWASDGRVSALMLRQAMSDAIAAYQLTQPPSTTLRSEYFFVMNTIDDRESRPLDRLLNDVERGKRIIRLAYANWLTEIDLPRWQQTPRFPGRLRLFAPATLQSGPSPFMIEQYCSKSSAAIRELGGGRPFEAGICPEQTRQSLLEVTLAAQLYFRDHCRFPQTSSEFRTSDLTTWPTDPFNPVKSTIQYRCDVESGDAVVWSVGPNKVDDGGNVNARWDASDFDQGVTIQHPH
jgi:uncharacterized protein YbjQ (UPF0145 family)